MTIIDASLFIDAERGRPIARARLARELSTLEDVALSTMTVLELRAGQRMARSWRDWLEQVFLAVEVVDLDREAARLGAKAARKMARRGLRLHNADAAVAGCAARVGALHILTADEDFAGLPPPFRVETVRES